MKKLCWLGMCLVRNVVVLLNLLLVEKFCISCVVMRIIGVVILIVL